MLNNMAHKLALNSFQNGIKSCLLQSFMHFAMHSLVVSNLLTT